MSRKRQLSTFLLFFFLLVCQLRVFGTDYLDSLERTLPDHQNKDDLAAWIKTHKNMCKFHLRNGAYKKAIKSIDNAENNWWREPKDSTEHSEWGWALVNRGYVKTEGGDFAGAKLDYVAAFNVFDRIDVSDLNVINYVYHPLANIYTRLGENEQAIQLLTEFISANEKSGNTHFLGLGYNDLGLAYVNKGASEMALHTYQKGLQIAGLSSEAKGLIASNLAALYEDLNRAEEGIEFAMRSLKNFRDAGDNDRIEGYRAGVYITLATLYSQKGVFQEAQSYLNKAEILLSDLYPDRRHRKWGKLYLARGKTLMKEGKLERAITSFQEALRAVLPHFNPTDNEQLPSLEIIYPEVVILEALTEKAEAYYRFSKRSAKRTHYLKKAQQHYAFYFECEGVYRREYLDSKSKLDFVEELHTLGERALNVTFELYELTKDQRWLKEGVLISEQTKGIILAESTGIHALAHLYPKELQGFIELKSRKSHIRNSLRGQNLSSTQLQYLKQKELEVSREILLLDKTIRDKYPVLHRQLFETNRYSLSEFNEFQQTLELDVLTYYFGEEHIYCFGINRKKVAGNRIPLSKEVLAYTTDFRKLLNRPEAASFEALKAASTGCYQSFFSELEPALIGDRIVVIPDGNLSHLPFEAFCRGKGGNFKNLDYLVRDYTFYYAYSIKQWRRKFAAPNFKHNFLGIAPGFDQSDQYAALPFSEAELKAGVRLGGKTIVGNAATVAAFIKRAKDYRILHLSTHAATWSDTFGDAFIAFAEKGEVHHLLSSELSTLQLSPELIVLSACETGRGDYVRGEGVLSLSRIFARTGSKNIIGSLWKVNHASNSELWEQFYSELENGQCISQALTQSKRNYLEKESLDELGAHPYYWSGMIQVGNDELHLESASNYMYWLIGAFAVIVLLFMRRKSAQRRR